MFFQSVAAFPLTQPGILRSVSSDQYGGNRVISMGSSGSASENPVCSKPQTLPGPMLSKCLNGIGGAGWNMPA